MKLVHQRYQGFWELVREEARTEVQLGVAVPMPERVTCFHVCEWEENVLSEPKGSV